MADHNLHLAQGAQDFDTFARLWPKRWGTFKDQVSPQVTVTNAMQSGSAFLVRRSDNTAVGAVVIDLETYERTLFVPILLAGGASDQERADVRHAVTGFIVKAALTVGAERMLFIRDADPKHDQAVKEFAGLAKTRKFPGQIHVLGTVQNLFGDGRTVSINSVFIPAQQRPNVLKTMMGETHAAVLRAATTLARASGDDAALMAAMSRVASARDAAVCSGCGEKGGKDGDKHDKKDDAQRALQVDPARAGLTGLLGALPKLNVVSPPGAVSGGGGEPTVIQQPIV
jgi:hypothetical protein